MKKFTANSLFKKSKPDSQTVHGMVSCQKSNAVRELQQTAREPDYYYNEIEKNHTTNQPGSLATGGAPANTDPTVTCAKPDSKVSLASLAEAMGDRDRAGGNEANHEQGFNRPESPLTCKPNLPADLDAYEAGLLRAAGWVGTLDKPDFVFRVGEVLHPWALAVLATDPRLPDAWWQDETFQMQAAGFGFTGRPSLPPADAAGPDGADWELEAARITSGALPMDLESSEVQSIEIGVRGYRHWPECGRAHALFAKARAEEEVERLAANERARKRRAEERMNRP